MYKWYGIPLVTGIFSLQLSFSLPPGFRLKNVLTCLLYTEQFNCQMTVHFQLEIRCILQVGQYNDQIWTRVDENSNCRSCLNVSIFAIVASFKLNLLTFHKSLRFLAHFWDSWCQLSGSLSLVYRWGDDYSWREMKFEISHPNLTPQLSLTRDLIWCDSCRHCRRERPWDDFKLCCTSVTYQD